MAGIELVGAMFGIVTAVITVVVCAVQGARWMFRTVRGLNRFLEDWNGAPERPGHSAQPGVLDRLRRLEVTTDLIVGEVKHNGGSSMKDMVRKIMESGGQTHEN